MTRRIAIGGSRSICTKRHYDAAGRMIVSDSRVAVSGDDVIAAAAFKLVEGRAAAVDARAAGVR